MKIKIIKILKVSRKLISTIIFLLIAALLLDHIGVYVIPRSSLQQQDIMVEEESDFTIDIAFIGSSSTYRYYDPMTVWGEYGITSIVYGSPAFTFDTTIAMIEYAQANQNFSVYVIDLRCLLIDEYYSKYYGTYIRSATQTYFYETLTMIPTSFVKTAFVLNSNYSDSDAYLHIFDAMYYHSSFLTEDPIYEDYYELEAYSHYGSGRLALSSSDVSESYVDFTTVQEQDYTLTDETVQRLTELLEYGVDNDIKIFFAFTPYVGEKSEYDVDIMREITTLIESYGFPCEDYRTDFTVYGLDVRTDFYNENHTNLYGAQKYTSYAMQDISQYLGETSDYSAEQIDSWNETYEDWTNNYEEYTRTLEAKVEKTLSKYE